VSDRSGITRFEWEMEIPIDEARDLLRICEPGIIDKNRYLVQVEESTFEVDEFYGENQGLIIAEIELKSEDEAFRKPAWLGEEVTGKRKYYNSKLSKKPFSTW
jgi:adenylate cyclase